MNIHCALCGKPFETETVPQDGRVACPHCGESFDLASRETLAYSDRAPLDPDRLPGNQIGGYRIEKEIGRGGMGIVYEGVQESLDRKVAIKVLFRETCKDPQFVARFEREAESLAKLSHPNIIHILDRGSADGIYYFVMEYVDGISLRALMDQGPLEPAEALTIIPVLCDALEYAHKEGVIHRDIKPENILIDKQGRVKIADFGLSRIVRGDEKDSRITRSNMVMGTPDYMAPEQRQDSKGVDHRADIFSLGVVFYEMLTGELPVGRFPPPSQKDIRLDIRLDEIVLRVLDKDPDRRYQRASDIATDLQTLSYKKDKGADRGRPVPIRVEAPREGRRGRSFLEILEDGWESWVLVVVIVLTIYSFFPNVLFLVGWIALYKPMRMRRLERRQRDKAEGRVAAPPVPRKPEIQQSRNKANPAGGAQAPSSPAPDGGLLSFEQARDALGVSERELRDRVDSGKLRAEKRGEALWFRPRDLSPAFARPEKPVEPRRRRTSFLALTAAVYGLALLLIVPLFLPFQSRLEELYGALDVEQMAVALASGTLAAIPGLLGLLFAAVARTRVAVHDHLGGAFLAMLGLMGSVVFLGFGANLWYGAYRVYDEWTTLEERARAGDPEVGEDLKARLADRAGREKALEIASGLPVETGREFYATALNLYPDSEEKTLSVWAKHQGSDDASRQAILVHLASMFENGQPERRRQAVKVLAGLRGEEPRELLMRAAKDPVPDVRREAAKSARDWDDPALLDTGEALACDEVESVAREGFRLLEAGVFHGDGKESSRLWTLLYSRTPHRNLKYKCLVKIRILASRTRLPEETLGVLKEAAKGADGQLAEMAKQALREGLKVSESAREEPRSDAPPAVEERADEGVEEEGRKAPREEPSIPGDR